MRLNRGSANKDVHRAVAPLMQFLPLPAPLGQGMLSFLDNLLPAVTVTNSRLPFAAVSLVTVAMIVSEVQRATTHRVCTRKASWAVVWSPFSP